MRKSDGSKYCDWCGKYCGPAGIDTFIHTFCSERCKRAYDNANGTVDGGYNHGSIGHKFHKTVSIIDNIFRIVIFTILGGTILLGVIIHLMK